MGVDVSKGSWHAGVIITGCPARQALAHGLFWLPPQRAACWGPRLPAGCALEGQGAPLRGCLWEGGLRVLSWQVP